MRAGRHAACLTAAWMTALPRSHAAESTQLEGRTHVSQADVSPNPSYRDEPPRINPKDVAATRALGRGSTYGLWAVLALGVLVLALAYFALRQAGVFPGANGGAVVDTNATGSGASGAGSGYGPTGNTGTGTGASSGTTVDSRVSGSTGGVTNGGVSSTGSSTGSGTTSSGNSDTSTTTGGSGPNTGFGPAGASGGGGGGGTGTSTGLAGSGS